MSSKDKNYRYFDRDISWLAFNKRVLMESLDKSVPIYERINFLSIFSSNLEEFYQVRVASEKGDLHRAINRGDKEEAEEKEKTLEQLTDEVKRQEELFRSAWEDVMVADLYESGVEMITDYRDFEGEVKSFVDKYFIEEIFPYLQPVLINPSLVRVFVRDKRIYLCAHLRRHSDGAVRVYMIKLPFTKAPRFLKLPNRDGRFVYTFIDEVIRAGLPKIFPGYEVLDSYSFKTSRDADIIIDDEEGGERLAESIEMMISKRKIGSVTRFQYDDEMPQEVLEQLKNSFGIDDEELLPGRRHLQLTDLRKLPNPLGKEYEQVYPKPIPHYRWDSAISKIDHILMQDEALFVPYTSFQYLLDMLNEACYDPRVKGIKLTQYRVAEDSEVIDVLIKAASSGKEVTVFVELKARFDEENNLETAQRMERQGVKIIYSLPGLKVHAKTCLIEFYPNVIDNKKGIACFSTGNFNESTAKIYSDVSMFSSRSELAGELAKLFEALEDKNREETFEHLLVASFNMVERIHELVDFEINEAKNGRPARIILKMNSLEEQNVIDKLYEASEAGVKIDLLVRGICRVIPNQPYSRNIRVIRLLDIYLEHARIWYFSHAGEELYFISSADWMRRNLYRRIECAAPVLEPVIKEFLGEVLELCMSDNVKATILNEHLENIPKRDHPEVQIRTQREMYDLVKRFNKRSPFPHQMECSPVVELKDETVEVSSLKREPKHKTSWLTKLIYGKKE